MCIAFFEWTDERFLVCHNRDEFLSRPTVTTNWWPLQKNSGFRILAPRDVVSGGTWFGFEKATGRCAFLTNITEPDLNTYPSSRGDLVVNYLTSDPSLSALEYLERIFVGNKTIYAGFNLVVFSGRDLAYVSNRGCTKPKALEKGKAYGLSNSLLDKPFPKVTKGLELFGKILDWRRKEDDDNDTRLLEDLEGLMQRKEAYYPRELTNGEQQDDIPTQRRSIYVPHENDYGTRTTIRFVLQNRRDDESGRVLRWIEKDWNEFTSDWEDSLDLECQTC